MAATENASPSQKGKDLKKRRLNGFVSRNSPLKQALQMLSPRGGSRDQKTTEFHEHNDSPDILRSSTCSSRKRSERSAPITKENGTNHEPCVRELYAKEHGEMPPPNPGTPDRGTWRKTRSSIRMQTGTFSRTMTAGIITTGTQMSFRIKTAARQIPDVRSMFSPSPVKPENNIFDLFGLEPTPSLLFGKELIDIMKAQLQTHPELEIPALVRDCIDFILKNGLQVQGVFRISASSMELDALTKLFDTVESADFAKEVTDIHLACCLLKKFLRDLPTPVIPLSMEADVLELDLSASIDDPETLQQIKTSIISNPKLPPCHFHVLEHIVLMCNRVAAHSDVNRMDASNLAVVFGPNIQPSSMPEPGDAKALLAMMAKGGNPQAHINHLLHALIKHSDYFFPHTFSSSSSSLC